MWSSIRFVIWYFQLPISYIYPPTFYAVSDKFTIFDGRGKCNIWQYSETGHLHGIGERVDLSRFMNGTTIKDLML